MNRRALAKGVAWAAPAIMVAAAAPSLAASSDPVARVTGYACKMPGNSGQIKHGYRVTLSTDAEVVVPVEVTLSNGRHAQIVGDADPVPGGFEFVVDATSSPSTLTVHAVVDGHPTTVTTKAHPHCTGGAK